MVAYNFHPRFIAPIEGRWKKQTIRKPRKRNPKPGEELQLYTGMRTKACRLIGRATCVAVHPIRMRFVYGASHTENAGEVVTPAWNRGEPIIYQHDLHQFAGRDGQVTWFGLMEFWKEHHGLDPFEGVIILWKDFRRAA